MKHPNYVPKFDFLFFNPIHGNFVPHPTTEIFGDENSPYQKKTILIGLPGAFTPVCTTYQIPEFEERFDELISILALDSRCLCMVQNMYDHPSLDSSCA